MTSNATDFPVDDADLARLRSRLTDDAEASDVLDVAYRTIDSPIGPLLLAATERGLVRVAFGLEDFDTVLAALADKVSPRVMEFPRRLDSAATEIDQYFAGDRREFDLPLDFSMTPATARMRRTVQRRLPEIGYGQTRTYREVAESIGNPKAVRAVGTACATNPLPVVLPCHRVLRSDGSLGGYLGGLEAKTTLLALETPPEP